MTVSCVLFSLLCAFAVVLQKPVEGASSLLVGNTFADNIVEIPLEEVSNATTSSEFVTLPNPDHILSYETELYVSSGDELDNSAIYKISSDGEEPLLTSFASGNGMKRPYGFDFYDGVLYVASFQSDQILMFDSSTGEFLSEFTSKEDGLCNGPNHISVHDGMLYLTTQGSNYINGSLSYMFASQIVAYDLETGNGTVFAAPEPMEGGLGFVSMLACKVYCKEEEDCMLFTTDFAGGLRVYTLDGMEMYSVETTYTSGASTGALSIDESTDQVYVTGFLNETTPGVVMRFDLMSGDSMPADGQDGALFFQDESLVRPIGIFVQGDEDSMMDITEDDTDDEEVDGDSSASALDSWSFRSAMTMSFLLGMRFLLD